MPIRRYRRDPRSERQRRADEEVLAGFERGDFLGVPPSIEKAAIEAVTRRQAERRQFAANLGVRLGLLRRGHGIPQQQLARVLGTTKSNIQSPGERSRRWVDRRAIRCRRRRCPAARRSRRHERRG